MNIETKFLGQVEIKDEEVISFEFGLPGFPDFHKFVLLPLDADFPLAVLQSTDEAQVGFVVAYPFVFKKDYVFEISDEDKEDLLIDNEEDVIAYSIVTLKETFPESTLNLLAPIIINSNKKLGKQIILQDNAAHPLRFPIGSMEGSAK